MIGVLADSPPRWKRVTTRAALMTITRNGLRLSAAGIGLLALCLPLRAKDTVGKFDVRYRIEVNLDRFPQKKPQEALLSVVKTVAEKRFEYLLAQLSLPETVDARVLRIAETFTMGSLEDRKFIAFETVARETEKYFLKDPDLLKEMRLFAAGAMWEEKDGLAIATTKDLPGRKMIFRKLEGRWFLENRSR